MIRGSPAPDRSVDIALAEFTALRAELLSHSTSQNAVLGLGFPTVGVLLGLAINNSAQQGLLVLVPALCAVVILVYAGLAYRIVVIGNYVRVKLWPFLVSRRPGAVPPSWEASLSGFESRGVHRYLSQVVELSLMAFLVVVGAIAGWFASGIPEWSRWVSLSFLVVAAATGVRLGWRRELSAERFFTREEQPPTVGGLRRLMRRLRGESRS